MPERGSRRWRKKHRFRLLSRGHGICQPTSLRRVRPRLTFPGKRRAKKEMPAFGAPAFPVLLLPLEKLYRKVVTARFALPKPTFHEAGTCFGMDMAAAAIIVARSTRLVHMLASCESCVLPVRLPTAGHRLCQPFPFGLSASTVSPCQTRRHLVELELEPAPEAPPELEPDAPASPPPQSLAAHCGSLGLSVAHLEDLLLPDEAACLLEEPFMPDDDLPLFDEGVVLASLLLLEPVDVPERFMEPAPPSLLVVPVLLVPVLLPLSDEPLDVPAVEPLLLIEELLGELLLVEALEGDELVVLLLDGDALLLP